MTGPKARPSRRAALGLLAGTLLGAAGMALGSSIQSVPALGAPAPFSFEGVKALARRLARQPPRLRTGAFAETLSTLDFDALGVVRYRPEAALWRDLGKDSAVEFFHLGRYARRPVAISIVDGNEARQVLYAKSLFDIPPGNPALQLPNDLGFAGFRVMNGNGRGDWLAFQGASYFRSAEPFNQYGLSARALAIDTAVAGAEEFPDFTHIWLAHDPAGELVVYALLEGPSVVGAYRMTHNKLASGLVQDVEAILTFRRRVQRLGIAPLTSMYWYGQADRAQSADWRPQIHDSDGLAMWTGTSERIWRPLDNPPRVIVNAFDDTDPRGFGLMQRDRQFEDYQDDGAFYDRRPSLWVEPVGPWGTGSVQLVELPTRSETEDNIVAFWSPAETPQPGAGLSVRYRLHWCDEEPTRIGVAEVAATRTGQGGRPGQSVASGMRKFVIDFAGGGLADLGRSSGVEAVVTLSRGSPAAVDAYPVVGTHRWRLMFDAPLVPGETLDLRAFLRLKAQALTETWMAQAFG